MTYAEFPYYFAKKFNISKERIEYCFFGGKAYADVCDAAQAEMTDEMVKQWEKLFTRVLTGALNRADWKAMRAAAKRDRDAMKKRFANN